MIEVDPRIERAFAGILARSRQRAADIADRVAATQREIEERSRRTREEGKRISDELDRQVAEKRERPRNPWQNRETRPTVLAFGVDDEEKRPAPPPQPPVPPMPRPEPQPQPNPRVLSFEVKDDEGTRLRTVRPAPPRPSPPASDDNDDYSGRSWMR